MTEGFCAKWQGTCHTSDLDPVFGYPFRSSQLFSDEEKKISTKLMDTFTHFAKKGLKIFKNLSYLMFKINNLVQFFSCI
jgi:hypothetical protein